MKWHPTYGLQDVIFLRQMMNDGNGSEEYKRLTNQKLDAMLGLCEMASNLWFTRCHLFASNDE